MTENNKIKLNTSCILSLSFDKYQHDFSFIVNGEEFKTSRIEADLLSPRINEIHSSDPTFDVFTMNTNARGNFSHFLDLTKFQLITFLEDEIPFITEVIEILGTDFLEIADDTPLTTITVDNVINLILKHEGKEKLYGKRLNDEIDFISAHFYEICDDKLTEISKLKIETLYKIVKNDKLQLKSEDQLLKFINSVYKENPEYSILYEAVLFINVSQTEMAEFNEIFDFNDLNASTWKSLSIRLEQEINKTEEEIDKRYIKSGIEIKMQNEPFSGIFNYIKKNISNDIEKEVDVTTSSICNNNSNNQPKNVFIVDESDNRFYSENEVNSWICFDFRNNRVIPTDYTLKSYPYNQNNCHLRSWVIECSNDNKSWTVVDERNDCSYLNGNSIVHTFKMNKPTKSGFRYIRIRIVGPNWSGDNCLVVNSFEIFGNYLVE